MTTWWLLTLVSAADATVVIVPTAIVHLPPTSGTPWSLTLHSSRHRGWRRHKKIITQDGHKTLTMYVSNQGVRPGVLVRGVVSQRSHSHSGLGEAEKLWWGHGFSFLNSNACTKCVVDVAIKLGQILVRPWPDQPEQLPRPSHSSGGAPMHMIRKKSFHLLEPNSCMACWRAWVFPQKLWTLPFGSTYLGHVQPFNLHCWSGGTAAERNIVRDMTKQTVRFQLSHLFSLTILWRNRW